MKISKLPEGHAQPARVEHGDDGVAESFARLREETERRPSKRHLEQVRAIFEYEVNGQSLPLRRAFIASDEDQRPPLSLLLPRAGLDAVQLKTFLLVLCMAAYPKKGRRPLYAVPYDADVYARALDLPDVKPRSPKGARRVRDAVRKLEELSLLQATRDGAAGPRTTLRPLREDGDGSRYQNPAGHDYPKHVRAEGNFVQVPHALLRNGWLSVLSGAALTTWLVLRESDRTHWSRGDPASLDDPSAWTFVSPSQRESRYHISQDTYLKGLGELKAHGLVLRRDRKTKVGPGPFDWSRQENVKLLESELDRQPERAIIAGGFDQVASPTAV